MTGMGPLQAGDDRRSDRVRADVVTPELVLGQGETAVVEVEVTNVDEVIRSYKVDVLGLDPEWIQVDATMLDLFPGERRTVPVAFRLPTDFPAGRRSIAIEISEPGVTGAAAVVVEARLSVAPIDALTLAAEPATIECGSTGTFVVTVFNAGNTTLDLEVSAMDPERAVTVTFEPPDNRLYPGERCVVQATGTGKRPWFGMPAVRVLDIRARAGTAEAISAVAFMQRPRVSRRVITAVGLLAVVTLFAFVILKSFSDVAALSEQNAALIKSSMGEDEALGARIAPASLAGQVTSTTGGGIDGVAVELYEQDNPVLPKFATVTDAEGNFRFGGLAEGAYLLRFQVAGFGEIWYPAGETFADAEPVEVAAGDALTDLGIALDGRPGAVGGTVLGADVADAVVTVQLPAAAIEGSDVEPVPAVVATMAVDASGAFLLPDLPTPATYEVQVAKPGFATELRTISLGPGETRDDLQVLLRKGDGVLSGSIVDTAGTPLGGASITATDGAAQTQTRSLSGDETNGFFELRDLATPSTYTITVTAPGYFDQTVTLTLEAEQRRDDLTIVMTADRGSLAGTVSAPDGTPLGGVTITVGGADFERTTESLSVGEVGAWHLEGLPVPGTYTVTFRDEDRQTQALSVDLVAGPESRRTGVDAVLGRANASINGVVANSDDTPVSGVQITLERSGVTRNTISSDAPLGAYGFDRVPPGAYTLTFRRAGSTPQTLLIDLRAGETVTAPRIQLEEQARITGVFTRDGVGEAGVGVTIYTQGGYPGSAVRTTITGAGGVFTVEALDAPQTYIVEFQVPAGGPPVGSETVFLRPGEAVNVEFDL
jgi:uncharacterized membrane protein